MKASIIQKLKEQNNRILLCEKRIADLEKQVQSLQKEDEIRNQIPQPSADTMLLTLKDLTEEVKDFAEEYDFYHGETKERIEQRLDELDKLTDFKEMT